MSIKIKIKMETKNMFKKFNLNEKKKELKLNSKLKSK